MSQAKELKQLLSTPSATYNITVVEDPRVVELIRSIEAGEWKISSHGSRIYVAERGKWWKRKSIGFYVWKTGEVLVHLYWLAEHEQRAVGQALLQQVHSNTISENQRDRNAWFSNFK